jgi:hypothetical protein
MASYKERIMKAIEDSEVGLTTVDVAKRAGVSKTTVIKYLSVLKSEGLCEFVEVGPSKLWKVTNSLGEVGSHFLADDDEPNLGGYNLLDAEMCCEGMDCDTVSLSFKVSLEELSAIINRSKKRTCH